MIGRMDVTVDALPPTGDRADFSVRVVGPGDTDHRFPLSLTRTILTIWDEGAESAARELVDTLIHSHGTAGAFPTNGFWFDSYNSAPTVRETQNKILNSSWKAFLHASARTSLGSDLFNALEELDAALIARRGQPGLRSLDVLFEPSQALEDLASEAKDNAHFVFRICILSGIVDRLNFEHSNGSLNGLREWLAREVGAPEADALTKTFQQVKNLRKQYPIHEHFSVDPEGDRRRRREVVGAEEYFRFRSASEWAENWHKVLTSFSQAVHELRVAIRPNANEGES